MSIWEDEVAVRQWMDEANRRLGETHWHSLRDGDEGAGCTDTDPWETTVGEVKRGLAVWIKADPERLRRAERGLEVQVDRCWWRFDELEAHLAAARASAIRPFTVREAMARSMGFEEYPDDPKEARRWLSEKLNALGDECWVAMQDQRGWDGWPRG